MPATLLRLLLKKLGKKVKYLCWPGGGTNETAKRIAREVGYDSWTLPSREKQAMRNRPGEDPQEIKRMPILTDVRLFGRKWGKGSGLLPYLDVLSHQESLFFDMMRKLYKLGVVLRVGGTE